MKSQFTLESSDVKAILAAAEAHAIQNNWAVSIAIVDNGGHLLGMLRLDGAAPLSSHICQAKAHTSAMGKRESKVYEDIINGGRQSFLSAPFVAGMLEGGRIQDHLYHNIQNYYCTILFIGYCAKGTLGDRLLRGDPIIRLRNRDLMVYAAIKKTDLLSGHGDHQDLVNTVKQQNPQTLKNVFLVHGENEAADELRLKIQEQYGFDAQVPFLGQVIEI